MRPLVPPPPLKYRPFLEQHASEQSTPSCHCAENATSTYGFTHTCGQFAPGTSTSTSYPTAASGVTLTSRFKTPFAPPFHAQPAFSHSPLLLSQQTRDTTPAPGRRRIYAAQSLILFTIWGVVLSQGPLLQAAYNSSSPAPLWHTCLPYAAQILGMLALAPFCAAKCFVKGWWLTPLNLSCLFIPVLEMTTLWVRAWWGLAFARLGQGIAMGSLATVGTLCVSGRFHRGNVARGSMVGGAGAPLGALVFSGIAYAGLDREKAIAVRTGVVGALMLVVAGLARRGDAVSEFGPGGRARGPSRMMMTMRVGKKMGLVFAGYAVSLGSVFVYPFFLPLLLSNDVRGGHGFPSGPGLQLIALFAAAVPAGMVATGLKVRFCFGAMSAWGVASLVAGACYLNPASMPWGVVAWSSSVVYGVCLGGMMALYVRVAYAISRRKVEMDDEDGECGERGRRDTGNASVLKVVAAAGTWAAAGIVGAALVADYTAKGLMIPFAVSGGCMVAGGLGMFLGSL